MSTHAEDDHKSVVEAEIFSENVFQRKEVIKEIYSCQKKMDSLRETLKEIDIEIIKYYEKTYGKEIISFQMGDVEECWNNDDVNKTSIKNFKTFGEDSMETSSSSPVSSTSEDEDEDEDDWGITSHAKKEVEPENEQHTPKHTCISSKLYGSREIKIKVYSSDKLIYCDNCNQRQFIFAFCKYCSSYNTCSDCLQKINNYKKELWICKGCECEYD